MSELKDDLPMQEAFRLIQGLKESLDCRDDLLLEQNALQLKRLMLLDRSQEVADEIFRFQLSFRRGDHDKARQHLDMLSELLAHPRVRGFDLQMN
ncbi:MAG: hypothetical protein GJT30_14930 [Geobacter sp.]|nr:hypothetical protein [Geobacter sp.]